MVSRKPSMSPAPSLRSASRTIPGRPSRSDPPSPRPKRPFAFESTSPTFSLTLVSVIDPPFGRLRAGLPGRRTTNRSAGRRPAGGIAALLADAPPRGGDRGDAHGEDTARRAAQVDDRG